MTFYWWIPVCGWDKTVWIVFVLVAAGRQCSRRTCRASSLASWCTGRCEGNSSTSAIFYFYLCYCLVLLPWPSDRQCWPLYSLIPLTPAWRCFGCRPTNGLATGQQEEKRFKNGAWKGKKINLAFLFKKVPEIQKSFVGKFWNTLWNIMTIFCFPDNDDGRVAVNVKESGCNLANIWPKVLKGIIPEMRRLFSQNQLLQSVGKRITKISTLNFAMPYLLNQFNHIKLSK